MRSQPPQHPAMSVCHQPPQRPMTLQCNQPPQPLAMLSCNRPGKHERVNLEGRVQQPKRRRRQMIKMMRETDRAVESTVTYQQDR